MSRFYTIRESVDALADTPLRSNPLIENWPPNGVQQAAPLHSPSTQATEAPKPKRKLSRAGRAAIAAATKKRWAIKRAEVATVKPAATTPAPKKAAPKKTE